MSKFTIYSYPNNYRVHKAQIAAAYVGVEIKEPNFVFGKDNESDAFLALNPLGKVPCLETPQGPIFESNAIARYISGLRADKQLLGASYYENALVAQWVDFCANELENPRAAMIYPTLGFMAFNQEIHNAAVADMSTCLTVLNDHLLKNNFMVGKQITLADIALVSALNELYSKFFAPSYIAKFPNVTRWFTTCCNQPEFIQVLGKVVFNKVENSTVAPKTTEPTTASAPKSSSSTKKEEPTSPEIEAQGTIVRELKLRKAPKDEVQAAIDELVRLKAVAAQGTVPVSEKQKPVEPAQKDSKKEEAKAKKDSQKDENKSKNSKSQEETSKKSNQAPKGKQESAKEKAAPVETTGVKLDDKAVKACIKEGGKKGQDIAGMSTFGVHFFCVTVEAAEGEMKLLDKVLEGMNTEVDAEAEDRKGGAGDLGKMLFNANEHKLVILCHTPKEVTDKATAEEWMEGVLKVTNATVVEKTQNIIKAEVANDPDRGVFTLKLRDEAMAASFAFLRSRQLMIEDDSDDDVNYAAAAGINLNAAPGADY
jgi:glutathione S-transferase